MLCVVWMLLIKWRQILLLQKIWKEKKSLEVKFTVVLKHDAWLRNVDIPNHLNFQSQLLGYYRKRRKQLERLEKTVPLQASHLTCVWAPIMLEFWKLLNIFIENNTQCRILITTDICREKALNPCECLKAKYLHSSVELFTASKG